MKLLITLLTSYGFVFLKQSYESAKNQLQHNIDYDIVIIVNTHNDEYYYNVLKEFNNKCKVIRTDSNNKPGKGHNSTIEYFKNNSEYDYLIKIDGDDFIYPYSLNRIQTYLDENPDILILPFTDILRKNYPNNTIHYPINNDCYLCFNDYMNVLKQWLKDKISPFQNNLTDVNTAGRLFLLSRKALELKLKYDEDLDILEDTYIFLQIFEAFTLKKQYNIKILYDTNIYLYNKLNSESSTTLFAKKSKNKWLKSNKIFTKSIKGKFKCIRDWKLNTIEVLNNLEEHPNFSIKDKIKWVENLTPKLNLNKIYMNYSFIPSFYEFCKKENKPKLIELYGELLNNLK